VRHPSREKKRAVRSRFATLWHGTLLLHVSVKPRGKETIGTGLFLSALVHFPGYMRALCVLWYVGSSGSIGVHPLLILGYFVPAGANL